MIHRQLGPIILTVTAFLFSAPAKADDVADFYKGKTISIHVGFTAGGSYDFYARLLAEYMGRNIPGNPTIIVQNRPGAGSRTAASYVYSIAPKDGTQMAISVSILPIYQLLEGENVRYDFSKSQFLGNMTEASVVLALWHNSPVKTLEQARETEIPLGSTGRGNESHIIPMMMNAALGTKFKVVTGYPGITEVNLAMERGEVVGRVGSWENITQQHPQWITEKKVHIMVQVGVKKARDLPDVPLLAGLARNAEERQMLDLVSGFPVFARAPWLAPGVPADRVAALRRAFEQTMRDPEFLKFAKDRNTDISPNSAAEIENAIKKLAATPPALIAKARVIAEVTQP